MQGMDGDQVKAWEARCIEEQLPACAAACPLHLDARAMLEKVKAGDLVAAFAIYARVIPFPAIVSHICDHPCETACRRAEAGGALRIGAIERAIVEDAYPTLKRSAQRNRKPKRIAVIGGGLAGLTAAYDLAVKGHAVTVYEGDARPLERLYHDYDAAVLPPSAIDADLGQLSALGIDIRCRARVTSGRGPLGLDDLIDAHDAVLLAPGRGPVPNLAGSIRLTIDNRVYMDADSCATSHPKVFASPLHKMPPGVEVGPYSPVGAMYDGRKAALSVDRFLQGASLTANRVDDGSGDSCLYVNVARHDPVAIVEPSAPDQGYSRTEAIAEAARCFPCECKECVRACEFLKSYGLYPKRYIREIYNNDGIIMGNRKSNKMIDSCSMCGLCADICPNDLSMGDVVLEARRSMVRRGHMPPSHHDFALRDMAFARSDEVAFARPAPGATTSAYLFFPGCQLTASSPQHSAEIYAYLRERLPGGVAFVQDCCGAPAHWAGREELHGEVNAALTARWEALGRPEVITACASCLKMLGAFQPEMTVRSLWTVMEEKGWPTGAAPLPSGALAIHDPCTGRYAKDVQSAVRTFAGHLGAEVRELSGAERTTCCGFGGLAQFANAEVTDKIVDRRITEDSADYLTYCAMCRDNFARRGKRALHILDLAFPAGADPAARPDPGFSRRRDNRLAFRARMLTDLWGETVTEPAPDLALTIADDVRADMERKLILVEDVARTVAAAEAGSPRFRNVAKGVTVASHRHGSLTTWVEYTAAGDGFVVHRAWSHRMQVEARPS
ncbi:pyridine nucleotide-disulfide oxidoreductase/dicluster-binding protein [Oryzibacter oryziterrae]|uniref:pyridine nucleotide-disulfide oxidoreductase/dicluster-binding protein n=1 Tax=Oryzibacter oryziterrae TaxID=2766474 RepID=UPI001F30CF5B|nr:pyridine nucleotide-disulfide oxidoreductase/dicluster-binding protein [Oryzibacter oryziterrae]